MFDLVTECSFFHFSCSREAHGGHIRTAFHPLMFPLCPLYPLVLNILGLSAYISAFLGHRTSVEQYLFSMRWCLGARHSLGFLGLINLVTANIRDEDPFRASIDQLARRDMPPWPYDLIGDSWGSGVAYSQDVLYDNNTDNCLRTKESHGPQMEADTTWTGSFSSGLRDAACSGSRLVDLAKGNYQMGKVGEPDVVIMTSGGNNCDFGNIVDVCIYHSSPTTNYGPAYADDTDSSGACAKALDNAQNYITGKLQGDHIQTIDDLFEDSHVNSNPDFLLYVTGYAQFFGTDYDT